MPIARHSGIVGNKKLESPCIFFDRDGIVNALPDPERYVTSVQRFFLLPAFVESLRIVTDLGYPAVVVTNQRGIALGSMSVEDVDEIHARLGSLLAGEGLALLDIFVCPHDDDSHPWRKPNPGMLLEAARRHNLNLAQSWMIGDSPGDILAGRGAGCRTVLVSRSKADVSADALVDSMEKLPGFLKENVPPVVLRESGGPQHG